MVNSTPLPFDQAVANVDKIVRDNMAQVEAMPREKIATGGKQVVDTWDKVRWQLGDLAHFVTNHSLKEGDYNRAVARGRELAEADRNLRYTAIVFAIAWYGRSNQKQLRGWAREHMIEWTDVATVLQLAKQ